MDLMEKLTILADSAKYDVACTSSGVAAPVIKQALEALWRRAFAMHFLQTGAV